MYLLGIREIYLFIRDLLGDNAGIIWGKDGNNENGVLDNTFTSPLSVADENKRLEYCSTDGQLDELFCEFIWV